MTLTQHGRLIFHRSAEPIRHPVTKFGGLPVWVEEPAWPRSASTDVPMLFIGQVVIESPLFPTNTPRIAYLFITEDTEENAGQIETWDPRAGENAVIIQTPAADRAPVIIDGPHLTESYWVGFDRKDAPLELATTVSIEPIPDESIRDEIRLDRDRAIVYFNEQGQKIGGIPDWIQTDEMPEGWRLLLQLGHNPWVESQAIDTNWNFGTGTCYVVVSPDYSEGILLWQC